MSTRLGFVVVELDATTGKPAGPRTAFDWDGGTLFDTIEEAQAEAIEAGNSCGDLFGYKVAEVTLLSDEVQP